MPAYRIVGYWDHSTTCMREKKNCAQETRPALPKGPSEQENPTIIKRYTRKLLKPGE